MRGYLLSLSFLLAGALQAHLPITQISKEPNVTFTENKGQVSDQFFKPRKDVLYSGRSGHLAFHLKKNGISYQIVDVQSWKKRTVNTSRTKTANEGDSVPDVLSFQRIDISWPGMNENYTVKTDKQTAGYANYYNAVNAEPVHEVRSFEGVTYQNLYPGIDLHYYEAEGQLKYDYLVAPFADPDKIKIQINGCGKIFIDANGTLNLITAKGQVREDAPVVYQGGKKLNARWKLQGNIVTYEIENVDSTQPLRIDPAVRIWATYYGYSLEIFQACNTDASGNVIAVGSAFASTGTAIATSGSYQTTINGTCNGLIVKFNSNGVRQWATYYGSTNSQWIESCAINSSGDIYIAGTTVQAGSHLASISAHQSGYAGGFRDCFIAKFNASGVRQWGTYLGGSGADLYPHCAVDQTGNLYVSGCTDSQNNIATQNSHQPSPGGMSDGFLVKFNPLGVLLWGTYYGDIKDDGIHGCATDAAGNIYIAGFSEDQSNLIATPNSHQPSNALGDDAFLVKFNSSGSRLWGTYYGGYFTDIGLSCAVDPSDNVYLSGTCGYGSTSGIATSGAHQVSHGGTAYNDGFLAKFTNAGTRLWGTYYGGTSDETEVTCAVNQYGFVTISGMTTSGLNGLSTSNTHQSTFGGGFYDLFLAQFDPGGARLWGTYYGGNGDEYYPACTSGLAGDIYLSGMTNTGTGTVIATPGSHQPVFAGNYQNTNGLLAKFSSCDVFPPTLLTGTSACAGQSATLSVLGYGTISWYDPQQPSTSIATGSVLITPTLSSGSHTVIAAAGTCGSKANTSITIVVNPLPQITMAGGVICAGDSFTLIPSGALTYTFLQGGPVVTPVGTTSYAVIGTSTYGCKSDVPVTAWVTVNNPAIINIQMSSQVVCKGDQLSLYASGATSYTWSDGSNMNPLVIIPQNSQSYTVSGMDANGCLATGSVQVDVDLCVGIKEIAHTDLSAQIYPNPASENFVVNVQRACKIKLVNVLGEVLLEQDLNAGENNIQTSTYTKGIYTCRLSSGDKVTVQKMIIH